MNLFKIHSFNLTGIKAKCRQHGRRNAKELVPIAIQFFVTSSLSLLQDTT
ncbi:hypothetical protein YSA_03547 [Pseudomonas putida ND6]|uniref:Uncharacterized protein n=1 Tax=Pseudomonas putida ND6 TaxID=231023 RepID=I3UT66_PSEPU|nr:hypothetical protein YSA_03547 [Pseudomonas putida ND6]